MGVCGLFSSMANCRYLTPKSESRWVNRGAENRSGPVSLPVGHTRRTDGLPPCRQARSPKCDGAFDHLIGAGEQRLRERRVKGITLLVTPDMQKTLAHDMTRSPDHFDGGYRRILVAARRPATVP